MPNIIHETRERWLIEAVKLLAYDFFTEKGYDFPEKWGISCGFPKGSSKAIGQAWDPEVAGDGTSHMFISPVLDEPTRVLDVTLHEMIHVAVGIEEGHKGMFRKLAKEFELEGKMTATYVTPGTPLHDHLLRIAERLGTYPHMAMAPRPKAKKPTNSWVRYFSTKDEKYKVLVSPKMVEEHGAPRDPWGEEMEMVE